MPKLINLLAVFLTTTHKSLQIYYKKNVNTKTVRRAQDRIQQHSIFSVKKPKNWPKIFRLSSSSSTLSVLTHTTSTSSKKTAASTTSLSMTSPIYSVSGPASSVRLSNSMMMALGGKMHTGSAVGCGSSSSSYNNSHQQQQYRTATPTILFSSPSTATAMATASSSSSVYQSNVKSTTSRTTVCIPFHRRQQYDLYTTDTDNSITTGSGGGGGSNYLNTNLSNSILRCRSESVSDGGGSGGVCFDVGDGAVDTVDAAAAAASNGITTMHYQTSDTIPKQRFVLSLSLSVSLCLYFSFTVSLALTASRSYSQLYSYQHVYTCSLSYSISLLTVLFVFFLVGWKWTSKLPHNYLSAMVPHTQLIRTLFSHTLKRWF